MSKSIRKVGITVQDLALGVGTTQQTRTGAEYTVNKLSTAFYVGSAQEVREFPTEAAYVTIASGDNLTHYYFDTTSSAADNGTSVLQPVSDTSGRWLSFETGSIASEAREFDLTFTDNTNKSFTVRLSMLRLGPIVQCTIWVLTTPGLEFKDFDFADPTITYASQELLPADWGPEYPLAVPIIAVDRDGPNSTIRFPVHCAYFNITKGASVTLSRAHEAPYSDAIFPSPNEFPSFFASPGQHLSLTTTWRTEATGNPEEQLL